MHKIFKIPIDDIFIETRHLAALPHSPKKLIDSVKQDGMRDPIIIRPMDEQVGFKYKLVEGIIRYKVCKELNHTLIETIILGDQEKKSVSLIEERTRKVDTNNG